MSAVARTISSPMTGSKSDSAHLPRLCGAMCYELYHEYSKAISDWSPKAGKQW